MIIDRVAAAAPAPLARLWSPTAQVVLERRLWLSVLRHQRLAGLALPADAWPAYRRQLQVVDLDSIAVRELKTRHDVKARIEEYNALAGYECIHLGMTSADVVDNISQVKIQRSLRYLGLLDARFSPLLQWLPSYPLRGIKGAVGTMADQLELLGSYEAARRLDLAVASDLGFSQVMTNVSQVYYRSLDLEVVSRVMACLGGVDSPWMAVLAGFQTMVAGYAGETWNEGDVSTSVTRRVALPGALFAAAAAVTNVTPPNT